MLVDDGSASVALPEVPLLAVLPGTGGLTRVVDKRKVRRDRADVFCTTEEGVRGRRAVQWRLVDEVSPASRIEAKVAERCRDLAAAAEKGPAEGVALAPLERRFGPDGVDYGYVTVEVSRAERLATLMVRGPEGAPPADAGAMVAAGSRFWPLQAARELDDAVLHLRLNETQTALIVFKTTGEADRMLAHDAFLDATADHWLTREIRHLWKRVLKRIDLTSRSLVALIEPGSCFAGTLAELALACDRSYMLIGEVRGDNRPPASIRLAEANFGSYPMCNGLTRLQSRFLAEPQDVERARERIGEALDAEAAEELGLVTFALDDIDWADEVRVFLEERASFSPDALTGLEANLRFGGPETMESKIFARLTAWQNWIFQRPNAVGEEGALRRYGTGRKAAFDTERV
jgi:benzoyl-CoA-dihydrodiol lyase